MRLTVLGACGAWPGAGQACSGYLVEHDGFQLVVDIGYATVPRLLSWTAADRIDAVFVSHGHPDHCADLNPLLRARVLRESLPAPLPVYAPRGALDAVLALDRPGVLSDGYVLHEFAAGDRFDIGPFRADTRLSAIQQSVGGVGREGALDEIRGRLGGEVSAHGRDEDTLAADLDSLRGQLGVDARCPIGPRDHSWMALKSTHPQLVRALAHVSGTMTGMDRSRLGCPSGKNVYEATLRSHCLRTGPPTRPREVSRAS
jgi:Beta-lactamase superfamily domain